jgi:type IV pilus biogenesis protein CpaD/CtpE
LEIKGGWSLKRLLVCLLFLLVGCSEEQELKVFHKEADTEKSEQILKLIEDEEKIEKVNVVSVQDEWLVAVQMKQWLKFNKKEFESSFKKDLEKIIPSDKLIFSTDFKLYHESTKLIKEKYDNKRLKKELDQLKKLMEEET